MLFNSVHFLWFLPLVVILYYLTPGRYRWMLVLAGSYTFYMWWRVEYILLIVATTLVDYWAGLRMGLCESQHKRLPYLVLSLSLNLGLLVTFKYLGFFSATVNRVLGSDLPVIQLLLPLGISFHTFQSLGYIFDVYRGKQSPERHLGYFAVFVAYFPQMVAGPIERYGDLGTQLHQKNPLRYENLAAGFRLLVLGFFAKMAVADNLAPWVNAYYQHPLAYGRRDAALAIGAYAFQIYGDFWGYSLIATGAARLMGVRLAVNFRTPYLAASVADYWQRWHITLTSWFRDYLYVPLSLQLRGLRKLGIALSILITYLVSGLWHGANWTFVIWGGIWGMLYAIEFMLGAAIQIRVPRPWSWGHLVRVPVMFLISTLALVPFRSGSYSTMKAAFSGLLFRHPDVQHLALVPMPLVMLGLFVGCDLMFFNRDPSDYLATRPAWFRWTLYTVLIFCILAFGAVEEVPFIYFQF